MAPANISGSRIKLMRERLCIDQTDLAASLRVDHKINLDQSDISEIERGMRGVKDYELDAIARILNVEPCWLLRGE